MRLLLSMLMLLGAVRAEASVAFEETVSDASALHPVSVVDRSPAPELKRSCDAEPAEFLSNARNDDISLQDVFDVNVTC